MTKPNQLKVKSKIKSDESGVKTRKDAPKVLMRLGKEQIFRKTRRDR